LSLVRSLSSTPYKVQTANVPLSTTIFYSSCSGETFLGACEVLFKEKPAMAIFENVINAPWVRRL
jgi:hypothetical protein